MAGKKNTKSGSMKRTGGGKKVNKAGTGTNDVPMIRSRTTNTSKGKKNEKKQSCQCGSGGTGTPDTPL